MIDYNGKTFRSASNSENGQVNNETIFHYQQKGLHVTGTYSGGYIVHGILVAVADENGNLIMRYQQVNTDGFFLTGICFSTPEIMPDGKIRLHEKWQWTCGNYGKGESVVEEI